MEFRCRLGTPGGEIVEGVYVAESEARLRREFEEKGLYVLAIQRAGRAALGSFKIPRRSRISTREFLVFNQGLATLVKVGCRSVIPRLPAPARRESPPQTVLDDAYDRVRAGSSLSEAFESHGTLFPGVYTASLLAGEKSGSLEGVIRRYVAYVKVISGVKRKTISALVYPAILLVLSCVVVGIIVLRVVPEFGAFYNQFGKTCRRRASSSRSRTPPTHFFLMLFGRVAAAVAFVAWLRKPGHRRRFRQVDPRHPDAGSDCADVCDVAGGATLATLLGGGIPLVNAIDVAARPSATSMVQQLTAGGPAGS